MAIVGESGSGKTTLALAIARLVPIYAGKVLVNGIDLYGLTRMSSEHKGVNYSLFSGSLFFTESKTACWENCSGTFGPFKNR